MHKSRYLLKLISYITDAEGNAEYFKKYASISPVVSEKNGRFVINQPDSHFVFGGDSFDLGGGDLELNRILIQLKKDYPKNVHLILGNRDVNKMVFRTSLDGIEKFSPEEAHRHIYPIESPVQRKAVGYADYLRINGFDFVTTRTTVVKWVLKHRMASPNLFEHRRMELAKLSGRSPSSISDEEMTEHFLNSAKCDDGAVVEYLRHGQLAALIGNSLFVHGGVHRENVGFVPFPFGASEAASQDGRLPGREYASASEWVEKLHELKEMGFEEWMQHPKLAPCGTRTGGEFLRSYAFRYTPVRYSVMVNSYVDFKTLQLQQIDVETQDYLERNNIQVVCSGHQPAGDSPTIIQTDKGQLFIMADNSYCAEDNSRGKAVTEVLIEQDEEDNVGLGGTSKDANTRVRIHGCRADSTPFDFVLSSGANRKTSSGDLSSLIGKKLHDSWWTKIPVEKDNNIICQKTTDAFFYISYKTIPAEEVLKEKK